MKTIHCWLCQFRMKALKGGVLPAGWSFHHSSTEAVPVYLCDKCSADNALWRICVQCLHIENTNATRNGAICPRCARQGHMYRMLGVSEFEQSRRIWGEHPWPEVVATALAAIDAAEQALLAAIENLEGKHT